MGQLEDMAMFVRVVEAGGIGKAAEQLNLATSAVSKRLNALEKRLGTRLLNRTTRTHSLTIAGRTYYQHALQIQDDVAAMNAQVSDEDTALNGTLRLTVPLSFGLLHLSDAIDSFARQHPNLRIHIDFLDEHTDLVESGYELAIRITQLKSSSLQARPLTPIKHILCASPDYLKRFGEPAELAALDTHRVLQYGLHSHNTLQVTDQEGKALQIALKPHIIANNGDFLKNLAIKGHGITLLPTFITYQAVESGALVPVLTQYQLPELYAYAIYPQTRFLSRRCRLLIDFLASHFGETPYWDLPTDLC